MFNLFLVALKKFSQKTKYLELFVFFKFFYRLDKNFDHDRYRTRWKMLFERVFSKQPKRARYNDILKNQFVAFMEAMIFNLKHLVVLWKVCLEL